MVIFFIIEILGNGAKSNFSYNKLCSLKNYKSFPKLMKITISCVKKQLIENVKPPEKKTKEMFGFRFYFLFLILIMKILHFFNFGSYFKKII